MTEQTMKCKRCRAKAEVQIRHHNVAFCRTCFVFYFQRQLERAIDKEQMFTKMDRVLVAVSGGKDSLALWDALDVLGYQTTGVHLALGIGSYSDDSSKKTQAFAQQRDLPLIIVCLAEEGADIPTLAQFTNRPACAACGTAKRHYLDRIAHERGYSILATGHNLDDEAARLMGNVIRWRTDHLAKQQPVLEPNHDRFAKKVKPLYRLTEYETAVYSFFRGIDYEIDECPNSVGATQLVYKDTLNRLEAEMPGTKLSFVREFLRSAQPMFARREDRPPGTCSGCGMPAYGDVCSFCNLLSEVRRKRELRAASSIGTTRARS